MPIIWALAALPAIIALVAVVYLAVRPERLGDRSSREWRDLGLTHQAEFGRRRTPR